MVLLMCLSELFDLEIPNIKRFGRDKFAVFQLYLKYSYDIQQIKYLFTVSAV